MNVGVNMLLWATHVTREHVAALQAIKAAGADGVEIPIMEGEVSVYRELGKLLDDLGLKRTSSMAFVTPDVNPVSDDPMCRQAAVDNLTWLIECAHALGAPVICGPMYQTIGAVRRHGRVIKHFHCSANDRGIPGQDHVDWTGTFRALHGVGYDGWLVIEAFGRALPGLAAATKIWRDLFDEALDVARVGVPFVRETWERSAR